MKSTIVRFLGIVKERGTALEEKGKPRYAAANVCNVFRSRDLTSVTLSSKEPTEQNSFEAVIVM